MRVEDSVFLYCPTWDAPFQLSKHHLARQWARSRRVLYVEVPPNPLSFWTRREESARLWGRYWHGPVQVTEHLWVHTFFYPLPYRGGRTGLGGKWVNTFNQMVVKPQLLRVLEHLGFDNPILFLGNAGAISLLNSIPHRLLVYHCSDDFTLVPSFPASFPELEEELIRRCDLVIVTAEELRRAKKHLNPNIVTITNGADVEHFARTNAPETQLAPDLANLQRPVVGYIGSIFRWINQQWIKDAATQLPNWSFVFVGPLQTDISLLTGLPNVHFLGPKPYSDLPTYLCGFDVATVPFTINELTLRASPIKFYEYLASGVPVVASRLPDLEPFSDLAQLVENAEEFVLALQRAVREDTVEARQRRMAEAKKHSWDVRCAQIDAVIGRLL